MRKPHYGSQSVLTMRSQTPNLCHQHHPSIAIVLRSALTPLHSIFWIKLLPTLSDASHQNFWPVTTSGMNFCPLTSAQFFLSHSQPTSLEVCWHTGQTSETHKQQALSYLVPRKTQQPWNLPCPLCVLSHYPQICLPQRLAITRDHQLCLSACWAEVTKENNLYLQSQRNTSVSVYQFYMQSQRFAPIKNYQAYQQQI